MARPMTHMTHARALAGIIGILLSVISMSVGLAGQGDARGADVIVPHESWSCGLPDGIPSPEGGTLVFEAAMTLDRVADVGRTQYGRRQVAVVQGGTVTGTRLNGSVMTGAIDFELTLANGVIEVEQIYVLRTSDGRYVYLRAAGTGADAKDVRLVMDFEAPTASDVAWLNAGTYVGRRVLNAAARTMTLRVYDVSTAKPAAGSGRAVRITKPAGVPPQPWDFRRADPSEQRGEEILTEIVTLGRGQSVQGGKRGNRNVLPITGGTLTGLVSGKILFGGADYQSLGNTGAPPIDARYLWQTTEGDIIIVRNTTNAGIGLIPTFETRVDGKYAWLNSGKYLSSPPGMGPGGLTISMYKSK